MKGKPGRCGSSMQHLSEAEPGARARSRFCLRGLGRLSLSDFLTTWAALVRARGS